MHRQIAPKPVSTKNVTNSRRQTPLRNEQPKKERMTYTERKNMNHKREINIRMETIKAENTESINDWEKEIASSVY